MIFRVSRCSLVGLSFLLLVLPSCASPPVDPDAPCNLGVVRAVMSTQGCRGSRDPYTCTERTLTRTVNRVMDGRECNALRRAAIGEKEPPAPERPFSERHCLEVDTTFFFTPDEAFVPLYQRFRAPECKPHLIEAGVPEGAFDELSRLGL